MESEEEEEMREEEREIVFTLMKTVVQRASGTSV